MKFTDSPTSVNESDFAMKESEPQNAELGWL